MGDNRGQTIFLSVIGIATLLVTIIGATFAYFTTQVKGEGSGGFVQNTTATIDNTSVTFSDANATYKKLAYPGGIAIVGAKAEITKGTLEDSTDSNDYQATFDITITYKNPTDTDLTWSLYKVEDAENALSSETDFSTMPCDLRTKTSGSSTYLWYGDDANSELGKCELVEAIKTKLGEEAIATGKLEKQKAVNTEIKGISGLTGLKLDTKSNTDDYYYLVVEYPNQAGQTEADQGQTINITLGMDTTTIQVNVMPAAIPGA